MMWHSGIQLLCNLLLTITLLWCVVSDLLLRRIPNRAVLLLLGIWLSVSVLVVTKTIAPLWHLSITPWQALPGALVVFAIGFVLFLTGRLGAGDVKLFSVLCLWVGYGQQSRFVLITALAGGALALALPLLNTLTTGITLFIERINDRLRITIPSPPVLSADLSRGIPYGIAIAFGAAYILIWPQV